MPTVIRPQTIHIQVPQAPAPCEKKPECPCYEDIALSDEESEEEPLPPRPIPLPEPEPPGATEEELNEVKGELQKLTEVVGKISRMFDDYRLSVDNNFQKVEQNMKFLANQIAKNTKDIQTNSDDIKQLRKDMELMRSELRDAIG